jgi:hypothetical protein
MSGLRTAFTRYLPVAKDGSGRVRLRLALPGRPGPIRRLRSRDALPGRESFACVHRNVRADNGVRQD